MTMAAIWTVACPECGAEHELCYVEADMVPPGGTLKFTCPKTLEIVTVALSDAERPQVVQICPGDSLRVSSR